MSFTIAYQDRFAIRTYEHQSTAEDGMASLAQHFEIPLKQLAVMPEEMAIRTLKGSDFECDDIETLWDFMDHWELETGVGL